MAPAVAATSRPSRQRSTKASRWRAGSAAAQFQASASLRSRDQSLARSRPRVRHLLHRIGSVIVAVTRTAGQEPEKACTDAAPSLRVANAVVQDAIEQWLSTRRRDVPRSFAQDATSRPAPRPCASSGSRKVSCAMRNARRSTPARKRLSERALLCSSRRVSSYSRAPHRPAARAVESRLADAGMGLDSPPGVKRCSSDQNVPPRRPVDRTAAKRCARRRDAVRWGVLILRCDIGSSPEMLRPLSQAH